jgi:hypothetical protein
MDKLMTTKILIPVTVCKENGKELRAYINPNDWVSIDATITPNFKSSTIDHV